MELTLAVHKCLPVCQGGYSNHSPPTTYLQIHRNTHCITTYESPHTHKHIGLKDMSVFLCVTI